MSDYELKVGSTSQRIMVTLNDSSSTTGAGLTGLAFNTASLVCYYAREDDGNAGAAAVSLATATKGTWATGGFVEKDATNFPGEYEFSIPNALLAAGSKWVKIKFKGAANLAPRSIVIRLLGIDPDDAVRMGMTALPNAAANAAGGLPVSAAGALDLDEMNVDIEAIQTSTAGLSGATPLTAAQIATGVWQDTTAGDFTAAGSIGKSLFTSGNAPGAASGLALVGSNMGSASSVTAAVTLPSIPAAWITAAGIASGALTNPKFGAAAIDSTVLATSAETAIADALLDRDMSVGTDSGSPSARTVRQALRMLRNKASISAGTLTVTKEDDATSSWTAAVVTTAGNPISSIDPA